MLQVEKETNRKTKTELLCYHCGAPCITDKITTDNKLFCCEGCKLVYEIINEKGLCDYYKLQSHPGLSQIKPVRNDKFAYLDNEAIIQQLYKFNDGKNAIITLYIPGVHCASCMWLLEHLQKLNNGITQSRLNFTSKEVTIYFHKNEISLRKVVELLSTIGYEPYISLDDVKKKTSGSHGRSKIYKLGVAGFCFGNIMMMSFPEYLSSNLGIEHGYANLFRYLNLALSIPVFFYSASEFYVSAWKGLKQRTLNIDAPIVLALIITYTRSIYEILSGLGGGYLDSMSGIVFFMLVGRIVQERTYKSISFNRDYKSYFPIAVDVITSEGIQSKSLRDLQKDDVVQLHNEEIIPADAMILEGTGRIDYGFVTGESEPVSIKKGETVYAGGKQMGEKLTIRVIKPVATSYLTSLWNHRAFLKNKNEQNDAQSTIHVLSRYFTYALFTLAAITGIYWWLHNPALILPSVSAMLIVACPCALLLSATYTNGNLLRIFSNNGLFLRDNTVIEEIGKIDEIVFDKTGTLTQGFNEFIYSGHQLTDIEKNLVYNVARSSKHPYSKALVAFLGGTQKAEIKNWKEIPGEGVEAMIEGRSIKIGSATFIGLKTTDNTAAVYVRIDNYITAFYPVPLFRDHAEEILTDLKKNYRLALLSGDNDRQRNDMQHLFGIHSKLLFEQKPIDKLNYIEQAQRKGHKVIMIGDGLNDAGALQQSDVGITLTENVNNFTPSCDAILNADKFRSLPGLLKLARSGKKIITASFILSIIYNIAGLYISVQGMMKPMIAAILMPVSTLSIVLLTTGASSLLAKVYGLRLRDSN